MVQNSKHKDFAFGVLVVLLVLLSIKGLITVLQFVGYVSYLEAEGGTISEIEITAKFDVTHWSALYGTAWGVGWTDDWTFNLSGNTTLTKASNEKHLLFVCLEPGKAHEVYASMVNPQEVIFDSLQAATTAEWDAYMGVEADDFYSATNTFTSSEIYEIGDRQITAPTTYTYVYSGSTANATSFATGILKDNAGHLVLVTKILNTPVDGFTGDRFNYQMILPIQNADSQVYHLWTDPTDVCPAGQGMTPWTGWVFGNVTDTNGNPLGEVVVEVTGKVALSGNQSGNYTVLDVPEGTYNIYAMKTGYKVYRGNVTVTRDNGTEHNIVMIMENPPNPPLTGVGPGIDNPGDQTQTQSGVGPGTTDKTKDAEYDMPPVMQRPKKIEGTDYIISIAEINRKIRLGNFLQDKITLYSFKEKTAVAEFALEGNISHLVKLDKTSLTIASRSADFVTLTIFGVGEPGVYNGSIAITGDLNATIPVVIEVLPRDKLPVEALLIDLELNKHDFYPGDVLKFKTDLKNLLTDIQYPVSLFFSIQDLEGKDTIWTYDTNTFLKTSFSLIKSASIPKSAKTGDYVLRVTANYLGLNSATSTIFRINTPWYLVRILGPIRVWHVLIALIVIGLGVLAAFKIKQNIESKKKFHLKVELAELPKPGPRAIPVGKIAETETKTYFSIEAFMTHCIVAGSTGSGKSVSAQVIVEEMLMKNVAVIVFDPTAQWTGMLRKCEDKTLLALYPFYGMKPTDAKPFNGNIRQITNPREIIDIKKYVRPGEVQVFACHKLEPKEMDMFVANSIRQIFRAQFPESRSLKILFVYDEVHRLLPKFGGSGEGFLQIERGCREFRKWGLGILLISQVLSDFVGTIKANINTEIQMRTRDEGDLERIRVKYGEEVLRSLVKATVGSGMVENPGYNRGKPYFVAFRPLMHSVARLSDDEISKYNEYNEKIDQLMFELDELEKAGLDVFDLKLELKLAQDKVKTGSFSMVQIYIEGLEPRIKKYWDKLGRTAPKLEKRLISEEDMAADIAQAKKAREQYEAEKKAAGGGAEGEKKDVDPWKKDVNPEKILKLVNGMIVINLASLYDEITAMKDDDYAKHVTPLKNDFAEWIRTGIEDPDLGDHLKYSENKKEMLDFLQMKKEKKPLPKIPDEKIKKWNDAKAAYEAALAEAAKKAKKDQPQQPGNGGQGEAGVATAPSATPPAQPTAEQKPAEASASPSAAAIAPQAAPVPTAEAPVNAASIPSDVPSQPTAPPADAAPSLDDELKAMMKQLMT